MSEGRLVAIVPAWNESGAIGGVVDEIRAFDARIDVVVVDDASSDDTASVARAHGATVLGLPFNVGIGGAVQTGFRYARDEGYEVAVRLDGDGQHDAVRAREAPRPDSTRATPTSWSARASSTRAGRTGRPSRGRVGIGVFARLVSLLGGQHVTDTTSGFAALNRAGIELFAVEYPHDYPEVEATLVALRSGLRLTQVQVDMRERAGRDVVDHVRPVALLHRQGHARPARRQPPALSAARDRSPMTPIRASIAGAVASIILILVVVELVRGRRLKERYALLWLATGVVLLVLSALARGPEHDRRLARRDELPAGRALRGRDALHLPRAPALLDGHLAAHRRERRSRAADRAARGAAQPRTAHRKAEREDVPGFRVVDPVRADAHAIGRRRRRVLVDEREVSRRRDGLAVQQAVPGDARREEADRVVAGAVVAIDAIEDVGAPRPAVRPCEPPRRSVALRRRAARRRRPG